MTCTKQSRGLVWKTKEQKLKGENGGGEKNVNFFASLLDEGV